MPEILTGYSMFHWVATWSNPALDAFFRIVTDLGNPFFYYLVIAPLFWVVDRRRSMVLFLLLLLAALVNTEAKLLANTPRPDPALIRVLDLRPLQAGSPSFPSGHAQIAIVFWGYLAYWAGRRVSTAIAAFVIAAISFSRIYLAAHFPVDVLCGLLFGAAFFPAFPWLDRWAAAGFPMPLAARLAGMALVVVMIVATGDPSLTVIGGCFLALLILFSLPEAQIPISSRGQMALVVVIGVAVQVACAALLGQLSGQSQVDATTAFRVAALWIVALWAYPQAVTAIAARRAVET